MCQLWGLAPVAGKAEDTINALVITLEREALEAYLSALRYDTATRKEPTHKGPLLFFLFSLSDDGMVYVLNWHFSVEELHDVCFAMKNETAVPETTSKRLLIQSILTDCPVSELIEETGQSKKRKKPSAPKISKTKPKIKEGVTYDDLFQWLVPLLTITFSPFIKPRPKNSVFVMLLHHGWCELISVMMMWVPQVQLERIAGLCKG